MRSIAFLFFLTVLALLPHSIKAQCAQWEVGGNWSIQQSTTVVNFELQRKGSLVTGKANYTLPGRETKFLGVLVKGADNTVHYGDVDGTAKGDVYIVKVYWDNHNIGVYTGRISPTGKIEGDAYGEENPKVKVRWYSRSSMNCAPVIAAEPPPIVPTVKTIKHTGRPKLPDDSSKTPPVKIVKATGRPRLPDNASNTPGDPVAVPAPENTPMIRVGSNNVIIRAPQTEGHTTLTWDGGKDHPYAEVWVKVDDADQTFVVEQGQGSRRITVEKGKTYIYILTDSGKTLATVTVKFR